MTSAFVTHDSDPYKASPPLLSSSSGRNSKFAFQFADEPSVTYPTKRWIITWVSAHKATEIDIRKELESNNFNVGSQEYKFVSSFSQNSNPVLVFETPSSQLAIRVLSKLMKVGVDAQVSEPSSESVLGSSTQFVREKTTSQMRTNATSSDMFQSPSLTHRREPNESSLSVAKSGSDVHYHRQSRHLPTESTQFLLEANHSYSNLRFNSEPLVSSSNQPEEYYAYQFQDQPYVEDFSELQQTIAQDLANLSIDEWGYYEEPTEFNANQVANNGLSKKKKKQLQQQLQHQAALQNFAKMSNKSQVVAADSLELSGKQNEFADYEFDEKGNKKKKNAGHILYVKGIDKSQVNIRQLVHLFECFGEVEIGMHHTKSEYALIKFAKSSAAKQCIKELYGKEILGKNLLIHYSEMADLTMKYYANEKEYYVPNPETRAQLERKPVVLSKHLSIKFIRRFDEENALVPIPKFSVADLHFLFPRGDFVEPFTVTKKNSDIVLDFYSVGAAIAFVMENNFKQVVASVLPDGRYVLRTEDTQDLFTMKHPGAHDLQFVVHLSFISKSKSQ